MIRKFLSQEDIPESRFEVIRAGNYSTGYNRWFYIEVKDNKGDEYSFDLPSKLSSAYHRASALVQHINNNDSIKLSCELLDNNILVSISSHSYYSSRIEIKTINDNEERLAAILYTTDDWHPKERDEFYHLYRKGYTKTELSQIFGRENINIEWENARIRAGKESIITGQRFSDFFYGIDSDYTNVRILYGASHKFQFGEKKFSDSTKPLPIKEDETLFNAWVDFVERYRKKFSNRDEKVDFIFNFCKGDEFYKINFFSSNYNFLCPSSQSDEIVRVHLRVEEYSDGKPTAYSFYFTKQNVNEEQLDIFEKYGDAFIRYIMHLKDKVYQNSFRGYEGLADLNKKISIKSAVSAIMSRNMSHNIGSHCIQYTGTSLLDLANHSIQCGPKIRGVSSLLFYIQGRMDFLATLISGERFSLGPVDFKYHIFNRLIQDDLINLSPQQINNSKFIAITGDDELQSTITNFLEKLTNSGRNINGLVDIYYKLISNLNYS